MMSHTQAQCSIHRTRQTRPTKKTFPRNKAEKSPFQQHDLSILIVGPNQLKHRLSAPESRKSPFQQHVATGNPWAGRAHLDLTTRRSKAPQAAAIARKVTLPATRLVLNPIRKQRSPGTPAESRGCWRRRRDLNPRGAMHPYLLSRALTRPCDVPSADSLQHFHRER